MAPLASAGHVHNVLAVLEVFGDVLLEHLSRRYDDGLLVLERQLEVTSINELLGLLPDLTASGRRRGNGLEMLRKTSADANALLDHSAQTLDRVEVLSLLELLVEALVRVRVLWLPWWAPRAVPFRICCRGGER